MMNDPQNFEYIISWLLSGDISIQFQIRRDLLGEKTSKLKPLKNKIAKEGWGLQFMEKRHEGGHWGRAFYQPKWTSTHYTLLDLKNLQIALGNKKIDETLKLILQNEKGEDGGINPSGTIKQSDVCINGMFLNYASYFCVPQQDLISVVDFLLSQKMADGGFNCMSNRKGAIHSSLHSTISVLEGIHEYEINGYKYRLDELKKAQKQAEEFILKHRLFRSCKTGNIINPKFLQLHYLHRWYYDILRALDYFQNTKAKYDSRMLEAIEIIISKRTKQGFWKLAAAYPGQTHFVMEKAGLPSRWITFKALRILKHYEKEL